MINITFYNLEKHIYVQFYKYKKRLLVPKIINYWLTNCDSYVILIQFKGQIQVKGSQKNLIRDLDPNKLGLGEAFSAGVVLRMFNPL